MTVTDPLSLPFDTYQRYRLVTDVLAHLRRASGAERLRVLDVGGRTAVLRGFDLDDDVALVDVEPHEGVPGLVLGDGARLPFATDAFDVVCAFDTLEHVPPPQRDAFVDECARVASKWVVLAGPYDAPQVVRAEQLLQRFLKDKLAYEHRYLEEHRHNGLPDRAGTEARLAAAGAKVKSLGHANLDRWLVFLCVSFYLDLEPGLRELAAAFFRFYNENLYASDHAEPVYRHAVVAALGGAPLPDFDGLLDPPVAPAGALEPFAALGQELLAFDRQRDAFRAEVAKLKETIATLEEDLAGHREAFEESAATVEEKDAAITSLQADFERELSGHRGTIDELQAGVEKRDARISDLGGEVERGAAERERLEHQAAAETARSEDLGRQLEAERKEVADRDAELARLVDEIAERERDRTEQVEARDAEIRRLGEGLGAAEAERESLRHAVDERAQLLEAREHDLDEHKQVLAARDAQVGEQGAHIANLEAHLRDRNAELKRWPMAALRRVMWLFGGKPPTA
ncbi:MAG: methyltransferase domain-containing protein [Planctomycetota bacterium]